jgi:hypothetical protein
MLSIFKIGSFQPQKFLHFDRSMSHVTGPRGSHVPFCRQMSLLLTFSADKLDNCCVITENMMTLVYRQ